MIDNLPLRDLIAKGHDIANVLDVIASPTQAAVVREMCARLAGLVRADPPKHGPKPKPIAIPVPRRKPQATEAPLIPQRDGKAWCAQCERRKSADEGAACGDRFCKWGRG